MFKKCPIWKNPAAAGPRNLSPPPPPDSHLLYSLLGPNVCTVPFIALIYVKTTSYTLQ